MNLPAQRPALGLRATALLVLSLFAGSASAMDASFSVQIAEKEAILQFPNNPAVKQLAAWDAPTHRIFDRSAPFVELRNTSTCNCPITEFSISIGDTRYHFEDTTFGTFAREGMTMDANSATFTVFSDNTAGNGDDGPARDLVRIRFNGGGLMPNELVRFRVELAPDANQPGLFSSPDFRTVLFDGLVGAQDLNVPQTIINLTDPSDNAIVAARFTGDVNSTLDQQFADTIVQGTQGQYFNQFLRPYSVMEGIDMFGVVESEPVIPEPGSIALVAVCIASTACLARRRRS